MNDSARGPDRRECAEASASIAAFALGTRYDALPPKVLEWSKTAILDCLGVAVAGRNEESSRICADLARQEKAKEEAHDLRTRL